MMPSSSSSSSSVAVRVDKATSDLLIEPDWTMNLEICDSINSNHWQAKDVVKALKKRLQHKSSTVQFLALTLLETMVKNCGDYVHLQIVEKNILQDMVKIMRKKADTNIRNKVLMLLDSWQEAFGGPGGKYPQYYCTYEELKRSGVQFPKRSPDAAPIITPPATHLPVRYAQPGYGMPNNATTRLDEAMASEMESLSLSGLDAMRRVADLLSDMLQAVNSSEQEALKGEVIVDLVAQCRSHQKRLMQMLTSTGDEELLARGLEINDNLQSVLAKHDALASGVPLPIHNHTSDATVQSTDAGVSSLAGTEKETEPAPNANSIVPVGPDTISQLDEVDDEEDDFAQLARRHRKQNSQTAFSGNKENLPSSTTAAVYGSAEAAADVTPSANNALVLADPPPPVQTTKEQDMIDFLSLALTTTSPHSPEPPVQSAKGVPVSPSAQGYPNGFQEYPTHAAYNNYVAPWAQPQPQPQPQPQMQHAYPQVYQPENVPSSNFQQQHAQSIPGQPQPFQQVQSLQHQQQHAQIQTPMLQSPHSLPLQPQPTQPQLQPLYHQNAPSQAPQQQPLQQQQFPSSSQYAQYSPGYIPPPWAATPGYFSSNQRPVSTINTPQHSGMSYAPQQPNRPQQYNTGSSLQGDPRMSSSPRASVPTAGLKPFIPSYRLFEDLDVFRQSDSSRVKGSSSSGSPSLAGGPGQGMAGGNK